MTAPSPKGPELVFHDPLSKLISEQQAGSPGVPMMSLGDSRGPDRTEQNRLRRRMPATRADAIEAVSRDLELLARRRGNRAG